MTNEIEIMQIRGELQERSRNGLTKTREYILREQLKLIREELGEDNTVSDADRFTEAAEKLKAPKEIRKKILEIKRFRSVGNNSSESSVMRGYIETLLKMPWDKVSRDNQNIEKARMCSLMITTDWKRSRSVFWSSLRYVPDEERGKSHFVPDRTAGYRKDFHRSFCC